MDWAFAIPILAVVIWILANVARNSVEQAKKPLPRPAQRPKPASKEIERFLEEINRQRQGNPPARPAAQAKSAPPTVRPTPTRGQQPGKRRGQPKQRRPRPDVVILEEPEIKTDSARAPLADKDISGDPYKHIDETMARSDRQRKQRDELTFSAVGLRKLLATDSGMRTAFALGQILGSPKCQTAGHGINRRSG